MTTQNLQTTSERANSTTAANVLCDLSHLGLLEVSGTDALTFLQGQVTNDVKLLTGNNAHYSAYCTPKGRMLALFLAFSRSDHIHLQFNRNLLEPISKRLRMYVMRAKVEIKDVSDEIVRLGIHGPQAAPMLALWFSRLPAQDYELVHTEQSSLLKLPAIGNQQRFEIFVKKSDAAAMWDALAAQCRIVEKPYWDWLEIQAGIPDVTANTQEQFVPQMINLDLLNGINFKKGCYTGQEIVARTHYLGSVKRRTYLAHITSIEAPNEGDKIYDATNNEVGQIVRVAPTPEANYDALVELRIDAQHSGQVFWNNLQLVFKPLPYTIET